MGFLKQSTSQVVRFGPFVDDTDGVMPETALTITQAHMQLSKNGGAFAQKNAVGNAVHDSDGWYSTTLDTTDTATVGILILQINIVDALPVWHEYYIVPEAVFDALLGDGAGGYLMPTVAGRTLDVTATGAAGIDWANIENQTATVDLSDTGIALCDVTTTNTDMRGTDNANTVIPPTVAQMNARTLPSASYFDPATDTVANVTTCANNTDMRGTDNALLAVSAPTNFNAMVISGAGEVDSYVQGFLGSGISETTASNIATNFGSFYDNANSAPTTQVVDDVGTGGGGGGTDWTASERSEIRDRLGITGATAAGGNTPSLAVQSSIDTVLVNIEDLPTVSEFNARTLLAADYFDPATDTVANVTTCANNTDMRGTDNALLAISAPTNFSDLEITASTGRVDVDINHDKTGYTISGSTTTLDGLNDITAAQVNSEVLDVLTVDTFAESGSVPAATSSILAKLNWLFTLGRNKVTQTSTTQIVRNDADSSDIGTSSVSDDGTTFTRGKYS